MGQLERFLRAAYPDVAPDLVAAAATALGAGNPDGLRVLLAELEEEKSMNDLLKQEVSRLNSEMARHSDGYGSATRAGLDVLGERARQRRMEGYDDEHDDGHADFSLSAAAIAYALDARLRGTTGRGFDTTPPPEWPWIALDWKPKDIRQSLVVAAALLIAEIERIDRTDQE